MRFLKMLFIASAFILVGQAQSVEKEDIFAIKGENLSIELEVDGGIIEVRPSNDKRDCIITTKYRRDKCDVDIRYNDRRGQLDIVIDNRDWNFDQEHGDNAPKIVLELPFGPEISFTAHIKAGETKFELGDLTLYDFKLRHWAGETTVSFSEPNRMVMRTFDVNVKVGEVKLKNLGNALFEEADINSGIGELSVDFHGKGLERSMARIDLDIGETTIIVPENIGTKLKVTKFLFMSDINYPNWFEKQGNYYYSENYDASEKSLYLMISTGIGELGIKVN
ncbi:hypothetical protein EH223_10390 [candidate division KSB1 bacterium]|nr:hypothetical protein [candidate division KSB1 bacterium]RQW03289.1 MAG: hypothetical protein EH223_10390 [candidate division KSB1 bacterium]